MKLKREKKRFAPFVTQRIDLKTAKPVETVSVDIGEDFKIGPDLHSELKRSASLYAWYAQLKEHAHVAMKHAKYKEHRLFERLYDEIKGKNPKMTEAYVRNKVHLNPGWIARTERYMKWRDRYRFLHELCHAMNERSNNLRTLESSERKQRELG